TDGSNCRVVSRDHGRSPRSASRTQRRTQGGAIQALADSLGSSEKEQFVLDKRSPEATTELIATEILQRLSIRCSRSQSFGAEVFEECPVDSVCPRFCNDVDDSAGTAAELRVRPARGNLKFLDSFQRDVNCRALPAHLLAKKTVIVVAAVEADVVEDSALAVD